MFAFFQFFSTLFQFFWTFFSLFALYSTFFLRFRSILSTFWWFFQFFDSSSYFLHFFHFFWAFFHFFFRLATVFSKFDTAFFGTFEPFFKCLIFWSNSADLSGFLEACSSNFCWFFQLVLHYRSLFWDGFPNFPELFCTLEALFPFFSDLVLSYSKCLLQFQDTICKRSKVVDSVAKLVTSAQEFQWKYSALFVFLRNIMYKNTSTWNKLCFSLNCGLLCEMRYGFVHSYSA